MEYDSPYVIGIDEKKKAVVVDFGQGDIFVSNGAASPEAPTTSVILAQGEPGQVGRPIDIGALPRNAHRVVLRFTNTSSLAVVLNALTKVYEELEAIEQQIETQKANPH